MFDKCNDVRMGAPEDIEAIFALMMSAHAEYGQHAVDPDRVISRIIAAVQRHGSMIGVIGEKGGPLKGYVYLVVDPIWWSTDVQLLELSNFVHPDHRKSDYAKQLISFAKKCAEDLGIDLLMGVVSNERTAAKCRLYQRQLNKVGEFYLHRAG